MTSNNNISDMCNGAAFDNSFGKEHFQEEQVTISQFVTALSAGAIAAVVMIGAAFAATPAAAASDAAALKQAAATCKAQVKEQSQFHETSWYARHKLVKKCVKDAMAGH